MQLATEVWQTDSWTLCCTCVRPPHTHTHSVCIPSISLALMDKHAWKWQQDTTLKMTWWEIFPVICVVNSTFVTTARIQLGYFVWFQTNMDMHEYSSLTGGRLCSQNLEGEKNEMEKKKKRRSPHSEQYFRKGYVFAKGHSNPTGTNKRGIRSITGLP